ncbi:PucR family transcriptional regulator [Desulfosporosinus fructosivorans]|uniref:PucR family transcriptional regulator n=1 Tax=Desulfosporosinus fructosivorans TaxID=2018669 RepID=A0A4Z0R646_9FIRM|nr:PucR family transcriptional regulator [Desulfosporosinus fructosivorans]TGE38512.1 PucR family transcriptional regulator [Desulfosporosinus fructosivorans]
MLQNDRSDQVNAQELACRLSDATGLLFRVGLECRSTDNNSFVELLTLEVQVGDELVELVYDPGSVEVGPFTTRLLQALARGIVAGLIVSEQVVQLEPWTWEKLLNIALIEQWDPETFTARVRTCRLTGLSLGFPVLVHCSTWSTEVVEVLENLFPQAPVRWVLKPDLFIYVPLDQCEGGLAQQRVYGEALIEQIHAVLADELGVLATVFVGQVIEADIWAGFLEVRKLTELHSRFFVSKLGLAAWNVGIASLFSETRSIVGQDYIQGVLGHLNKELLETLRVFLEKEMSVADSSRALFIHRNTLTYRLDRITELTGYNPRRLNGAVHLYMALWLGSHTNSNR